MTRAFVCAAVLTTVVCSPLAAQNSPSSGGTAPPSRYKLQAPPKTTTKSATAGPSQPSGGKRPVLGPAAPPRTTTDRSVRQAGDTQPIREPAAGQTPKRPIVGNPVARPVDAAPLPPAWLPLKAEQQKWVDDVLREWEKVSSQVHYFECKFQRWEFEPVFGPRDGKTPKSYATGVIKYQQPDKGLFRVEQLKNYVAPKNPGDKPTYETPKDEYGEHWVCNGESIFEFDNRQRRLIERILPLEMQGKAIADGPLPFLFGAKAAAINQRYWIRPVDPPEGIKNEYWMEAWPKGRQDAANFKFVRIVIARNDFMPSALSVYMPTFDANRNPARMDYKFDNRKATMKGSAKITIQQMRFWESEFFEPKTPFGWKKEVQNLNNPPVVNGPQQPPPQARQVKPRTKFK